MPWPWGFIDICLDPAAVRKTESGRIVPSFRWPFPNKDALYNRYYLKAMDVVFEAYQVFSKDPSNWNADDDNFFTWMLENSTPDTAEKHG